MQKTRLVLTEGVPTKFVPGQVQGEEPEHHYQ